VSARRACGDFQLQPVYVLDAARAAS
jgi:hypothetical protein